MAHPPFQIGGNLGFVAGMTECIVRSHRGAIELLPAVPVELVPGSVRGMVARPGVEVDLDWESDGTGSAPLGAATLGAVTLRAVTDAAVKRHLVRWRDREIDVDLELGASVTVRREDFFGESSAAVARVPATRAPVEENR